MKTTNLRTLALLPAALLVLASCSTKEPPPPAGSSRISYTEGVPGGVIVQTVKATVTVTDLDRAKRQASLLGANGKKFVVKVSPEAVNFDQVQPGDRVNVTVVEEVVASLDKQGDGAVEGTAALASLDAAGSPASGPAAATTQLTAQVIAIAPERRTATLRFEDGLTETFPVRDDVDLSRRQVGERVVFRVTEMTAIWVEKAP